MSNELEETLKRIDVLQIAFMAKLGDKVKELSRLILQLEGRISVKSPYNQKLFKDIFMLSHNLAGSAGTFQYTHIYHKAKAIENLSSELLEKDNCPSQWHKLILELIVGLRGDVQVSGRPAILESFATAFKSKQHEPQNSDHSTHCPVIVLDDDELLVSLIKEQAKHFEYDVIPLYSTENLEKTIADYHPKAILIDIVFPNGRYSGIEIIAQLNAQHKINCPVIFMSNLCDTTVRLAALRAGSDAYIVKPLDILELIRVLDRLTQKLSQNKSKILFVDDDPLVAFYFQTALIAQGFLCEIEVNPMQVLDKALSFNPDAILLDISMPECDGFELAEIIRQDDAFSHIPILFLTSANTLEQEIHAVKSGGDDFLDKNAPLSSVIAIIQGHVQRHKELDSLLSRLKRNETRFRSVTSSSNDAIISVDQKGRIIFWNEGAENIFGYRSLEVIGQYLELIIASESRTKPQSNVENLAANNDWQSMKQTIETTAITKQKRSIYIELTTTEWISTNEHFYTYIVRDISERKKIEQDLSYKEAYLDAIISNSGKAIITFNSEGMIETANPKATQLFDCELDQLLGAKISTFISASEKLDNLDQTQLDLLKTQSFGQNSDLKGMRKDGSVFALELNVSPMLISDQHKFVGVLHDISERQQFIKELLLTKAGAEAASRAKSQFLSSMSHELRTPLNAIMGFTQLLQTDQEHPLNAEQQEALTYIYEGSVRLLTLVNNVLNLSRIESEVLTLEKERFNLVEFVDEVINQHKPLAMKSQITLNNLDNSEAIFVDTDKAKLDQVLNQLLSNALKYNRPQGSVKLFLTPSEHTVQVFIEDTGKGIPDEQLSELFKPFSRLGEEVGTIEGTGIGLALAKKLIEIMNAKIGVTSTLGQGSTFWIELARCA